MKVGLTGEKVISKLCYQSTHSTCESAVNFQTIMKSCCFFPVRCLLLHELAVHSPAPETLFTWVDTIRNSLSVEVARYTCGKLTYTVYIRQHFYCQNQPISFRESLKTEEPTSRGILTQRYRYLLHRMVNTRGVP